MTLPPTAKECPESWGRRDDWLAAVRQARQQELARSERSVGRLVLGVPGTLANLGTARTVLLVAVAIAAMVLSVIAPRAGYGVWLWCIAVVATVYYCT